MCTIYDNFQDLLEAGPSSVARFASTLPTEWIESALCVTGKASMRRRKLTARSAT